MPSWSTDIHWVGKIKLMKQTRTAPRRKLTVRVVSIEWPICCRGCRRLSFQSKKLIYKYAKLLSATGCINELFRNLTNLELTECISPWQWSLLRREQMGPTHEPSHIQKFKVDGDISCKDYLSHLVNTRTINEFFQNVSHGLFLNQCPGKIRFTTNYFCIFPLHF